MTELGDLRPVDLRDVWPHEAAQFTPWLAENLSALGNALGLELELKEVEAPVGAFALDILASEVGTGRNVTIENQLETTNHDHLGKLLTYASGYNADVVVWIAKEIREEHRQALDWLNQRTDSNTGFYGVVVETFRIDDSRPAFRLDVVARPTQWRKARVESGGGGAISERREAYRVFFQDLIDRLREQHRFTNARAGQPQGWYSFASGLRGITFGASFAQGGRVRAELYLGTARQEENKRLFDGLDSQRAELEQAFGEALAWERLDGRTASRIAIYRTGSIADAPEALHAYQNWLVASLLRLREVIFPRLEQVYQGAIAPPDVADPDPQSEGDATSDE